MKTLFEKRDPWGQGLAVWVLVGLLFAAAPLWTSVKNLRIENDVDAWLSAGDPAVREYAWFQTHFPTAQTVIVAWDGSSFDDPRIARFLEAVEGRVDQDGIRRGGLPYVERATTASDVARRMCAQGIEPEQAVQLLTGVHIGQGPLKIRLTDGGRDQLPRTIRDLETLARQELGIELEVQDPIRMWHEDETLVALDAADDEEQNEDAASQADEQATDEAAFTLPDELIRVPAHDLQVSWKGMPRTTEGVAAFRECVLALRGFATAAEPEGRRLVEDCFFSAGSPIAIVCTLSEAGCADQKQAIAALRQTATRVGVSAPDLHLAGRPVTEAELDRAAARAAWNPDAPPWKLHERSVLLLSALVGLGVTFFSLRSIPLTLIVAGLAYYAAYVTLAVVPVTGGVLNLALLVLPSLLVALALSSAIPIVHDWQRSSLDNPRTAVQRTLDAAWAPCIAASVAIAIGLLALLTSRLAPARSFGAYAAAGTAIALVLMLYGLPAILDVVRPRMRPVSAASRRPWHVLGALLCRRRWAVIAISTAATIACSVGLLWLQAESKPLRDFPPQSELVKDCESIEGRLANTASIETIIRFSAASQQRTRFIERLEVVRAVAAAIRQHPEISGALSLADFEPVIVPPADDARTREKILFNRRSNEIEARIKEDPTGAPKQYLTMSPADDAEELSRAGEELWRITAHAPVLSDADYGRLVATLNDQIQSVTRYHAGASHVVTGAVPLLFQTQQAVHISLIQSFGLATILIGGLMAWVLWNPIAGTISMLPHVFAVLIVFGLAGWCGQRIDRGTMITASIALGIAATGSLRLMAGFRRGLAAGKSRERAIRDTLAQSGPALCQSTAVMAISLLALWPSELLFVSRFGVMMSALVTAGLAGDLILLPALLQGPLGALLEQDVRARRKLQEPVPPAAADVPAPHIRLGCDEATPPQRRQTSRHAG